MNKRILNIGCGNDTYGTNFVDLYPQRKEVRRCNIDKDQLPYQDNSFDEVRMYFIFEHLKNQEHILKEVYRVLKKGGILDLKTDNACYWYYALDNTTHTGKYESVGEYGSEDKHYALFTDLHLKNHFKDAGFRNIEVKHSYENARTKNPSWKGRMVLIINFILTHIKPIKRMGFSELHVKGEKPKKGLEEEKQDE